MRCQIHVPLFFDIIGALHWSFKRVLDFLELEEVLMDFFQVISYDTPVALQWQNQEPENRQNYFVSFRVAIELRILEIELARFFEFFEFP